jgi:hypothetical protein
MSNQTDMFGNPAAAGQLNLFGEGEDRLQAPEQSKVDHATLARAKLKAVLQLASQSRSMPWSERDVRMWQTVFPQMANWLPSDEAQQMVLEFDQQIARLKAA